jgi:hypothetical protein
METNGEIVTGALSETGAALLFVRDDQGAVAPLSATGGFKLWLRHGAVVKYQLRLDAVLAVNRRRIEAHRTVHTILTDMGSTRLAEPVDVRAILDR